VYVRRVALIAIAWSALLAPAAGQAHTYVPRPTLARTVVLKPAGGTVMVKPRGHKRFKLREATVVPVRSIVDATHGKVSLTSARDARHTQGGVFSQGEFVVTQQHDGLTDLQLTGGSFGVCSAARVARKPVSAAANTRRRLFGSAHGHFRTRGRSSSATVRGTTWLTEDRCTGTVTENMSASPKSKVDTQSRKLHFTLAPGQTVTYFCNRFEIAPDTYCLVLLAEPAVGVIGGGIVTQVDTPEYALCVVAPDGQYGCRQHLPLTARDPQGFRQAIFVCPVRQVGKYTFGWSLDGQNLLFPALNLTLDVPGPDQHCTTDPTTPDPIAKSLTQR
jgi:hypothetical protein